VDAREGHAAMAGGPIFTLVCALLWLDFLKSYIDADAGTRCLGSSTPTEPVPSSCPCVAP
jgi:hypothetical protein